MVYGLGNKGRPSPSLDPMYIGLSAYLTITSDDLILPVSKVQTTSPTLSQGVASSAMGTAATAQTTAQVSIVLCGIAKVSVAHVGFLITRLMLLHGFQAPS